jgi:hypothetical protein
VSSVKKKTMSEKNTIDMEERLQVILLRAYAQKNISVSEWPYVAMEADGHWFAFCKEPRYYAGAGKWAGPFYVNLGVNGGLMVDPQESLFCWNAGAGKDLSPAEDDCVRSPLTAVRTVWLAIKEGEALRADVTMVAEPLPAPQEVPSMRRPTDEELDAFLGVSWAENCPLDV